MPFLFRKKFLLYYSLFLLLLLLIGIGWTAVKYFAAEAEGNVQWEKVSIPMSLPVLGLAGYVLLFLLWLRYKAKQYHHDQLNRFPEMFTPPPEAFPNGEVQYGDPDQVGYTLPGGTEVMGEIRFTSQRIVFVRSVDLKQPGALQGITTTDLTSSIPWNEIRQCRFGMNGDRLRFFVVIKNDNSEHVFGPIVKFNLEIALSKLKWRRKDITGYTYWTH